MTRNERIALIRKIESLAVKGGLSLGALLLALDAYVLASSYWENHKDDNLLREALGKLKTNKKTEKISQETSPNKFIIPDLAEKNYHLLQFKRDEVDGYDFSFAVFTPEKVRQMADEIGLKEKDYLSEILKTRHSHASHPLPPEKELMNQLYRQEHGEFLLKMRPNHPGTCAYGVLRQAAILTNTDFDDFLPMNFLKMKKYSALPAYSNAMTTFVLMQSGLYEPVKVSSVRELKDYDILSLPNHRTMKVGNRFYSNADDMMTLKDLENSKIPFTVLRLVRPRAIYPKPDDQGYDLFLKKQKLLEETKDLRKAAPFTVAGNFKKKTKPPQPFDHEKMLEQLKLKKMKDLNYLLATNSSSAPEIPSPSKFILPILKETAGLPYKPPQSK